MSDTDKQRIFQFLDTYKVFGTLSEKGVSELCALTRKVLTPNEQQLTARLEIIRTIEQWNDLSWKNIGLANQILTAVYVYMRTEERQDRGDPPTLPNNEIPTLPPDEIFIEEEPTHA